MHCLWVRDIQPPLIRKKSLHAYLMGVLYLTGFLLEIASKETGLHVIRTDGILVDVHGRSELCDLFAWNRLRCSACIMLGRFAFVLDVW